MKGKALLKSVTAILLCLAMTAVLFAGCGSKESGSSKQESSGSQQSSPESKEQSSSEASSGEANQPQGDLPQLKILIGSANIDPNDYYVPKKMKELTGYDVLYDMLPNENTEEVLNLKVSGGSDYDIITIGSSNAMRAQMETLARQGALAQLDDLLNEYGPNLIEKVDPICWTMTEVDGKRYIIANKDPSVIPEGNIWCPFVVRTDWLEKLNMEFPDTKEGFKDFLQAVKDQDPGGNGDLNIPLVLSPSSDMTMIRSAFDIYFGWNDINGKLVPLVKDPRYKEYLQYMQDLYKAGLLDVEFPTNLGDTVTEKFTAGRAAVSTGFAMHSFSRIKDALVSAVPDATVDVFNPLKNSEGVVAAATSTGLNKLTVIPANSNHKEDAMKYMNLKCDTEIFKASVIGDEGVHYNTTGENSYEPILPTFTEELNDAHVFICGADDYNYGIYWREVRVKKDPLGYAAMEKIQIDHPEIARVDPLAISPLMLTYAENASALNTMLSDFEVTVITGTVSIDEVDAFAERYMAEGGSAVEAEVNEWWSGYRDTYIENYGDWLK